MINNETRYLVFENSNYELLIDFIKLDNNHIDYTILSQNYAPSLVNSESVYSMKDKDLDWKNILSGFFSQDNLNKYFIITRKKLAIEETLFLASCEKYLNIKIIPQNDNKAKFIFKLQKEFKILEESKELNNEAEVLIKNYSDISGIKGFGADNNDFSKKEMITDKIDSKKIPLNNISQLKLEDLIDLDELNKLMKTFYQFNKAPVIIVDLEGNILSSIGMTDICTNFHRKNVLSNKRCVKSDIMLTKELKRDEIRFYKCLNNMYDLVSPLYVGGKHIANFFVGEFFFTDEDPDYNLFINQAKELGFDEKKYLEALEKVPRIDRDDVMLIISYYRDLLNIITTLAQSRLSLLEMNHKIELREEKLQQITDNMSDVVLTTDFDFNIKYISPSIERLTGYTQEEYRKLSMEERYPPLAVKEIKDSIALELEKDKNLANKKRSNINMLALFDKQKKIVLTSIHSKFVRNKQGEAIAIIVNIRDITKQIKAEIKLEQQLKLQSLLSAIAVKYINIPTNEIVKSINESLEQMATFVGADRAYIYEYKWEEEISSLSYEWVAPGIKPHRDILQNVPLKCLNYFPEKHKRGETVIVDDVVELDLHANIKESINSQKVQSLITIPIISDEQCFGFVGFDSLKFKNFFKESEITILSIFAQLIVNITNRVALENDLREERKKAEKSDVLKSNLLKNISHEFRTPLNGIVGFSELLQQKSSDFETGNMASMIYSSAIRLNHVLDSIMLLNQLEDINKKEKIKLRTTNISNVLLEISSLYKDQFKAKDLKFNSDIQSKLYGEVDEKLLNQAIVHILNNALKFTHKGGVKLHCYTCEANIILDIIDSGVGIPNESLKIIFSQFRQVSEGYNRAYEGVGLGLTIAKKIVDLMEGEISVKSKILEGSTFTITLPISNIDESLIQEFEKTPESNNYKIDKSKPKVLIVEDNIINQKLIISILKDKFSTDLAINGEVAIILAKKKKYDAILMDIHLGEGIDGLTTTRNIKKDQKNITTPIVAVTGYTMYGDKERILAEGCNYYLGKPYKKKELLDVLTKAITEY